jgi:phosphoglycerol transferase MdoB-like AlkP superfamily enzyme
MAFIRLFITSLAMFTALGFAARMFFAIYFNKELGALDLSDIVYGLFRGLRFDLAISAYFAVIVFTLARLFSFYFIAKKRSFILLGVGCSTLILMLMSDMMYYADAGRHISYEINDAGSDSLSLLKLAVSQYTLLFAVALASIAASFIISIKLNSFIHSQSAPLSTPKAFSSVIVGISLAFVLSRGGFSGISISPIDAYKVGNPLLADVCINAAYKEAYHLINSRHEVNQLSLAERPLPKDEQRLLGDLFQGRDTLRDLDLDKMNVVILLLESWPATLMRSYGSEYECTPFFDSLQQQGLSVDGMVSGGHRTTEGMFTTFCSFQNPLGQSVAKSQLTGMPYTSLAQILSDNGWSSAFFQGSSQETASAGPFSQKLGFKNSYGKREIDNKQFKENAFGAYDQDIYNFVLQKTNEMTQPFVLAINTNTTHDHALPEGIEAKFGMETSNQRALSTMYFADQALEEFITNYQADEKLGPTLFVLLADHTRGVNGSVLAHYLIPFILFSTDDTVQPQYIPELVSQRDLAPTVLDYLGGFEPTFSGSSLISQVPRFADYYHSGTLGWIEGDHVIEMSALTSGEFKSFLRDGKLDSLRQVPADDQHRLMAKRALAFTGRSQDLLFSGKTQSFFDELSD